MEDLLKRECIEHLVEQGLAESKTLLEGLGVEFIPPDDIDKQVMLGKMIAVCDSSGEEIVFCEDFLKSEMYKRYATSIKKMTGVILDYMTEYMGNNAVH